MICAFYKKLAHFKLLGLDDDKNAKKSGLKMAFLVRTVF